MSAIDVMIYYWRLLNLVIFLFWTLKVHENMIRISKNEATNIMQNFDLTENLVSYIEMGKENI